MTLLELAQMIAASTESDEINSISDTTEALQIGNIIKTCYNHITSQVDFPRHYDMFELNPSLDPNKPTLMYIPARVKEIEFIKYDARIADTDPPDFRDITYHPPYQFVTDMYGLNATDSDVGSFTMMLENADSFQVLFKNNSAPQYYTSLDDQSILFNSFNNEVDTTLQKNKTMCYGLLAAKPFQMVDNFEFDLSDKHIDLLFQQSKQMAWVEIKQMSNPVADRMTRRGWTKAQEDVICWPNYGRK